MSQRYAYQATIPSNQACAIGPQESYEVCGIDANRLAGDEDWASRTRTLLTGFFDHLELSSAAPLHPRNASPFHHRTLPMRLVDRIGHHPMRPGSACTHVCRDWQSGSHENLVRRLESVRAVTPSICSLSRAVVRTAPSGLAFLYGWRESGQRPLFDFVGGREHRFLAGDARAARYSGRRSVARRDVHPDHRRGYFQESRPLILALSCPAIPLEIPRRCSALIAKYITAETSGACWLAAFADDRIG